MVLMALIFWVRVHLDAVKHVQLLSFMWGLEVAWQVRIAGRPHPDGVAAHRWFAVITTRRIFGFGSVVVAAQPDRRRLHYVNDTFMFNVAHPHVARLVNTQSRSDDNPGRSNRRAPIVLHVTINQRRCTTGHAFIL
jgi:hypothetical protein